MEFWTLKDNGSFCILPFVHQEKKFNGTYHICCYGDQLQTDNSADSLTSFNSEKMSLLRDDMVRGVQNSICKSCYQQEVQGIYSPRQHENDTWAKWESTHSAIEKCLSDYKNNQTMHPISYDLRYSNTCTLKCRMCNSSSSSAINAEYKNLQSVWPEKFWTIQNPRINHEVDLHKDIQKIYLAGGEPLVEPLNLEFLNKLADFSADVVVLINTSLNHLTDQFVKTLNRFNYLTLVVSIDGTDVVNDYIRHGSKFNTVINNIKKMSHHDLMFSTCVSMYNIFNLPCLVKFIAENFPNKKANHGISVVNDIEELFIENVPVELRHGLIQQLTEIKEQLDTQPAAGIQNIITILTQDNFNTNKFKKFKEYTQILDNHRNENVVNIVPELASYFND